MKKYFILDAPNWSACAYGDEFIYEFANAEEALEAAEREWNVYLLPKERAKRVLEVYSCELSASRWQELKEDEYCCGLEFHEEVSAVELLATYQEEG